jgi:hypothetical protein
MLGMNRLAVGATSGAAVALGLGWVGLRVQPTGFPAPVGGTAPGERLEVPPGLPAPVARHVRATIGACLPRLDAAVLTGRGRLRFSGVTFPARLRFTHLAGRAYRHEIAATWFGLPLLRVDEAYVDDHARLALPFGVVAGEPKVDQGANLALWGEELFWLPSVLFGDPRVRWEPVDDLTTRLVVPFGAAEQQFTVTFDPATGLLRRLAAPRYRSASDSAETPWQIEPLGWRAFGGLLLPSPVAVTWQDEAGPWLVMAVEDVAYNVDVSASIRADRL